MKHLSALARTASLLCCFSALSLFAQLSPLWTAQTGAVSWMRTTSAGALVACTADGLKGIDPTSGDVGWTVKELANAPESGYTEITRTPFITVVPVGAPEDLLIVEPFEGTVLFNSQSAGIQRIVNTYFLYANNAIILVGQKPDKSPVTACIEMGTGKVRWTKDSGFSRLTACSSAGPDAILVGTLFFAYKLDANTGAELWKQSPDPKFASMSGLLGALDKGGANLSPDLQPVGLFVTSPNATDLCFMAVQQTKKSEKTDAQGKTTTTMSYSTFVNAFRISDGGYAWPQPLQIPQRLGAIVPVKQGLLVGTTDNNHVDLIDYASGNGKWGKNGKGISVKGPLSGAVEIGDRMLVTSGGPDGAAMLVDATGTDLWKKPVKVDGMISRVTVLPNGMLIASAEETDVVDGTTGASRLGGAFKGGAGLVATDARDTYLFNAKDGLLYRMPTGAGAAEPVSSTPLEFQGKEKPTTLQIIPEGFVVSSDQNIALISRAGAVSYQKYFPAPKESGLTRALKYASAVRAAYYTAAYGYTSAAFGAVSSNIQVTDAGSAAAKDITHAVSDVYGDASKMGLNATQRFLQEANARFKATASTDATHYMLTGEKNIYMLQAVNKPDGALNGSVPLGSDKTPRYEVDGFTNTIYLAEGATVKAFQ
ncbi:MAG: PQQ-binding-like beta-propeller repeat protein [Flavobacteriales bacterium]